MTKIMNISINGNGFLRVNMPIDILLGRFDNPDDAALAYDIKALELFGEFANTNF